MTTFYFKTDESETYFGADEGYDFPDLMSAIGEGKRLLAEMASDGIPEDEGKRLSVEVRNSQQIPVARLALEFHISFLAQ